MLNALPLKMTLISLCLFIVTPAEAQGTASRSIRPATVITEPLQFAPKSEVVELIGTAEAKQSVRLYPAVGDDVVTKINFSTGDWIERGSVLVQLDARHEQTDLELAQIELLDAQRRYERFKQLAAQKSASQQELDDAKIVVDLALNHVNRAQIELDDRQVVAPISGYVGISDIKVGDRITQSTFIATIDDRRELYVDVKVPEKALNLLSIGKEVELYNWIADKESITAYISEIDSRIEDVTRTIRVRINIENQDDQFRPGMSFRATVKLEGQAYAVIPEAALLWGATGAYIWRSNNGMAERVNIDVIQRQDGIVLVDGPLSFNDELIVEGVQRLRNKQPLNIVE